MMEGDSFGKELQRVLNEQQVSASQAARMVGFRSRNSIFRILSGETGVDVDARFLEKLQAAVGDEWPEEVWSSLERALEIKRVGLQQYRNNQAFFAVLREAEAAPDYLVEGREGTKPLSELLEELLREAELEIIICGCCDSRLLRVLAERLNRAGEDGSVTVRHYIDVSADNAVSSILGVLPLVSKPWYNARMVDEASCPPEMLALYRVHMLHIFRTDKHGSVTTYQLVRYAEDRFACSVASEEQGRIRTVLDRCRYQLELLKPLESLGEGDEVFINYTERCRKLEENSVICSIKPDICFNCLPVELLQDAITEGFRAAAIEHQESIDTGVIGQFMQALIDIHARRVNNMFEKRKRTDLVFSISAMERFMQTGVQSDHFFLQRPYTPEERREIIRFLYEKTLQNPYFDVYFLKPEVPEPLNEITLYEGKGVLLLDAYTGYALSEDHSEAVVELPVFMESFGRFFREEVLKRHVLSRKESLEVMERLMNMAVK